MKICFVASTYPKHNADGSARFIRSLAEAVVALGHEVHVLIPFRSDLNLTGNDVPVHTFRYAWPSSLEVMGYASAMNGDTSLRPISYLLAPAFALAEAKALADLHRLHHFDVIHAHWIVPNGAVAAAVTRQIQRPLVVSLHGSDIFVARKGATMGRIAKMAFRQCAAVTACSPELEQGARELCADPRTLHVIPWGADPAIFRDTQAARQKTRTVLGFSSSQKVILSLGRLVRKKGVSYLLEGMPEVLAAIPDAMCVIAGDGPERPRLEALSCSLGIAQRVRFLGSVPWTEVPELLSACDLFAVPSIHDENGNVDGLPTTIPEAMAAGCPVVATRVAGVELAVQHGVHGLLVAEKDPSGLAHALILLLTQPQVREALGANARRRVEDALNWRNIAKQFVGIYQESMSNTAKL